MKVTRAEDFHIWLRFTKFRIIFLNLLHTFAQHILIQKGGMEGFLIKGQEFHGTWRMSWGRLNLNIFSMLKAYYY